MTNTLSPSIEPWLTAQELARFFKVPVSTVRYWTALGVPRLKMGRLVRFNPAAVEAWFTTRGANQEAA